MDNSQKIDMVIKSPVLRLVVTWKGNLLIFGFLIVLALIYVFFQLRSVNSAFLQHVKDHSQILAGVIKQEASTSILSQEIIKQIMQTFLGNTGKFVDYLDTIEPFSSKELGAFAREAGLAGITIIKENSEKIKGPLEWLDIENIECDGKLQHIPQNHLYIMKQKGEDTSSCIVTGITASKIEQLQQRSSLEYLFNTLSQLPGIHYVKLIKPDNSHDFIKANTTQVGFIEQNGEKIVESRLLLGDNILIVGTETKYYFRNIHNIWMEFFIFSAILGILGIFFSWFLYYYQRIYLEKIRRFDEILSVQKQDAALGRATSSITHEIRNPLNAISMGLQRLKIETNDLKQEHKILIDSMLSAVARTNSIVVNLKRYTDIKDLKNKPIRLDTIIADILALYESKLADMNIELILDFNIQGNILGDPDLIAQLIENIIKNSIEAQPHGGYVKVGLDKVKAYVILSVENKGFFLGAEKKDQIFDSYFTTKARGTGLGLNIVQRIVKAHKGYIETQVIQNYILKINLFLPKL